MVPKFRTGPDQSSGGATQPKHSGRVSLLFSRVSPHRFGSDAEPRQRCVLGQEFLLMGFKWCKLCHL